MIAATNFPERFSDRLQSIISRIIGNPCSDIAIRLVPYLHSRREFIITEKPWHTSYHFNVQNGGPEWIPAGEPITLYFWRGHTFCFWKGKCTSITDSIEPGLFDRYDWDMSKYPSVFDKPLKKEAQRILGLWKWTVGKK